MANDDDAGIRMWVAAVPSVIVRDGSAADHHMVAVVIACQTGGVGCVLVMAASRRGGLRGTPAPADQVRERRRRNCQSDEHDK